GRKVDLTAEGKHEPSGWYLGNDSWRSQYSQERYVDYASPLPAGIFVDTVMLHLLRAIDEGRLHVLFVASNGCEVDLTTEGKGQPAGRYAGKAGWLSRFAQERRGGDGDA